MIFNQKVNTVFDDSVVVMLYSSTPNTVLQYGKLLQIMNDLLVRKEFVLYSSIYHRK